MKEAIALIIVMLMGAFAATKAEGANIHATIQDTVSIMQQHVDTIESQNPDHDRTPVIEKLLIQRQQSTNGYINNTLDKILTILLDIQDNKTNNPGYTSIAQSL